MAKEIILCTRLSNMRAYPNGILKCIFQIVIFSLALYSYCRCCCCYRCCCLVPLLRLLLQQLLLLLFLSLSFLVKTVHLTEQYKNILNMWPESAFIICKKPLLILPIYIFVRMCPPPLFPLILGCNRCDIAIYNYKFSAGLYVGAMCM